jgi:FAD dependent oxidoreductase
MIKTLIVLLLIANCSLIYAQTIKTDVLVIGASPSGVAAAMQSARSKAKTILAIPDTSAGDFKINGMVTVEANHNIPSGIWGEFQKHIRDFYKNTAGDDTTDNAPLKFDVSDAASILKKMADTVKNLTVYENSTFSAIKKDGDKWEVSIGQNGKTIKVVARAVVDATENGDVITKVGEKLSPDTYSQINYSDTKLYRTSIATDEVIILKAGDTLKIDSLPDFADYIAMNAVLIPNEENIFCTQKALPADKDIEFLPMQLELGQGTGSMAAFCTFFKTTTSHLNVRIIQGEILDFKGYLLPFSDIKLTDPAWRAIQQVCATGILRGNWQAHIKNGNLADSALSFVFQPDALVNTAEVQPVLTEIYTRAFLWFNKEKPGEKFTLGNLLSFISDYTLIDPLVLKARIQKEWKTLYKFEPYFDLNRQVTRREFAVLANKFLNPFARTVDLSGRLVN